MTLIRKMMSRAEIESHLHDLEGVKRWRIHISHFIGYSITIKCELCTEAEKAELLALEQTAEDLGGDVIRVDVKKIGVKNARKVHDAYCEWAEAARLKDIEFYKKLLKKKL